MGLNADEWRAGCTWTSFVLFGKSGNNPYCHHRALELAKVSSAPARRVSATCHQSRATRSAPHSLSRQSLPWGARKGSASAGLRYLHAHRQSRCGAMPWLQYGVDVRNSNLDALLIYGVGRFGAVMGGAPFGLELAVGPATTIERTIAAMLLGAYVSAYYVDLGVSYQLPLGADRPPWLGGGARVVSRAREF